MTVQIHDKGAPAGVAQAIRAALAAQEIACTSGSGAAAAIQITRIGEDVAPLPHHVPAFVVVADQVPDPIQLAWRLVRSGADDVVFWAGAETAEEIAARIARRLSIDKLAQTAANRAGAIGSSPAWHHAITRIVEAGRYGAAPILILGQTGAGKEVAARIAAEAADCPSDRISIVDCGAIAPDLIGAELFGHERGAFTGAHAERDGAVARADGGVLFLDEIGELPREIQTYFLRLLQDGSYRRIGGASRRTSRFRLVAATNRDLAAEVAQGRFREDLYHRIAAVTVTLPRLTDRPEDILPLAEHFLAQACGREITLDPAVRDHLLARDFPGNVRELAQLCQRLAISLVGETARIGDLARAAPECREMPATRTGALHATIAAVVEQGATLAEIKSRAADAAIRHALTLADGSTQVAAKRLGVTARALQLRAKATNT